MTLRLSPEEVKSIVADFVFKKIPSANGYPVKVNFIEVYSDGSGEGEVQNLSHAEVIFGKEALDRLMAAGPIPTPPSVDFVRPEHIDCPCWTTGRYVWVEGCSSHPRESVT